MFDIAAVKQAVAAQLGNRGHSSRTRRARTYGAAGFAGVSVALLAAELPASSKPPADLPAARFAVNTLVDGLVAVPVRFADAASSAFLRPGDRIDVLAAADADAGPGSIPDDLVHAARGDRPRDGRAAVGVVVLAVHMPDEGGAGGGIRGGNPARGIAGSDGLVYLAVDNLTAEGLARAAAHDRLSYALRPG